MIDEMNKKTPPIANLLLGVVFCYVCQTRIERYNPIDMKWVEMIDRETNTYLCSSECRIELDKREGGR